MFSRTIRYCSEKIGRAIKGGKCIARCNSNISSDTPLNAGSIKRDEKFHRIAGSNCLRAFGGKHKGIGVISTSEMNAALLNNNRYVLRMISDQYADGRRITEYTCEQSEWNTSLYDI
jgi:hypothetical protein